MKNFVQNTLILLSAVSFIGTFATLFGPGDTNNAVVLGFLIYTGIYWFVVYLLHRKIRQINSTEPVRSRRLYTLLILFLLFGVSTIILRAIVPSGTSLIRNRNFSQWERAHCTAQKDASGNFFFFFNGEKYYYVAPTSLK